MRILKQILRKILLYHFMRIPKIRIDYTIFSRYCFLKT